MDKRLNIISELCEQNKYSECVVMGKKILKHDSDNCYLLRTLSFCYHQLGNNTASKQYGQKAHKLAPNDALVIWDYSNLLWVLGHKKQALKTIKKILLLDKSILFDSLVSSLQKKTSPYTDSIVNDVRYLIAEWLFCLDSDEAETYLKEYIANREKIHTSVFSINDARKMLQTMIHFDEIGRLLPICSTEQAQKLERILNIELKKDSDNGWLWCQLAKVYSYYGNFEKMAETIKKAIDADPEDAEYLWLYCVANMAQKKYDTVIEAAQKILNMGVQNIAKAYGNRLYAMALANDCKLYLALSYKNIKEYQQAKKWMLLHLKNRKRGMKSIYSKTEAQSLYKDIKMQASRKE